VARVKPRREDDGDPGYSAVIGKDLIYCGEVCAKLTAFLWENLLRSGARLGGDSTAKEGRRLFLSSPGGYIYDMISIVDLLEETYDVTTVATGICMSAAIPIIAAGSPGKRYATHRTRFMLHPSKSHIGEVEIGDIDVERTEMEVLEDVYAGILSRYCKHDKRWWRRKGSVHKPWYFGADVALEHGIIDHIIPDRLIRETAE
jgi:ATP-dependent protease ClpP protease subunit